MSETQNTIDLLITFLGKTPKGETGYRETVYTFSDERTTSDDKEKTAFFGWSLQNRIKAKRVLVLGTETSMWDHLFEKDNLMEQYETLSEQLEYNQPVTQQQLNQYAPLLSKEIGFEITLQIIPYCKTDEEQSKLLQIMEKEVSKDNVVHMDVTHGFRHLPMLSLLAAFYLERLKNAEVSQIWYGSFNPDTMEAPVYQLSGLLEIAKWLQVIAAFDNDGDYGVFIPLLQKAGFSDETINTLKQAAYFENVLNVGEATGKLRKVLNELKNPSIKISPSDGLFLPVICKRLEWIAEDKQFEKQLKLAELALERGDYLRSILYAYESVITHLCQCNRVDVNNFEGREKTRKSYEEKIKKNKNSEEFINYKLLKHLRNQVAHGSRGTTREAQKILLDEDKMKQKMKEFLVLIRKRELPSS